MSELAKQIEDCNGAKDCFGMVGGIINPIAFSSSPEKVKVIIVSEQPKGERASKEVLKQALRSGRKNSLPQRMRFLLGHEFADSVIAEEGAFYWTHFIKCPGKFRDYRKGLNVTACADKHLMIEIRALEPSLLISVGGRCSQWLLSQAGLDDDWRDCILEQLCGDEVGELSLGTEEPVAVKTIFLIHPSERSGIGWHIDKKLANLVRRELNALG